MAVFRYKAMKTKGEGFTEEGTIVGTDEKEVTAKLNQYGFDKVRLKRIRGLSAV